jgi:hypothetical protein
MDPTTPTPGEHGPARPTWFGRLPRAALAGGIAAGVALGGAGIAYAASSTSPSTTTPPKSPSAPNAPMPRGHRGFFGPRFGLGGPGGVGFGIGGAIHGQFTVPHGNGYETVVMQVGTASGVSPTTITVTSTDKYQLRYKLTASTIVDAQRDGINSVHSGDQVRVLATTSKGTNTAISITDITRLGASGKQFGFGPGFNRPAKTAAGWGPATA